MCGCAHTHTGSDTIITALGDGCQGPHFVDEEAGIWKEFSCVTDSICVTVEM